MFQPLAKITGYLFGFLILTTIIVFGTAFMIVNTGTSESTATTIDSIPANPPVELTATAQAGETLFKANCASCHKIYKKAVGPALHNVADKYEREWLYKWIKNSAALIKSGDAQAVAVYQEYNQSNMNAFPQLSNEEIDNILEYTSVYQP